MAGWVGGVCGFRLAPLLFYAVSATAAGALSDPLHHGSRHARGSIADPVAPCDGRERSAMEAAGHRSGTMATVGVNAFLTLTTKRMGHSGAPHDPHTPPTTRRRPRSISPPDPASGQG